MHVVGGCLTPVGVSLVNKVVVVGVVDFELEVAGEFVVAQGTSCDEVF